MPALPPMLRAALWAVPAAIAAREAGLAGAALAIAVAVLWCLARGRAGAELLAVPAALAAVPVPVPPLPYPETGPVQIEGRVEGPVEVDPLRDATSFGLRAGGGRGLVVARGLLEVLPGDRVTALARCGPQIERRRSGRQPVFEVPPGGLRVQTGPPTPARFCEALRLAMQRELLARFAGEAGLLLSSLVLGRGPELPAELARAHRATGLSHLLAVSGAHASMLAWMLGLLWLGRPAGPGRTGRLAVPLVLLVYAALTGMEPPVFRAVAAFLLLLWARARGRRPTLLSALVVPALLTCLYAPAGLMGVSFSLSYAAVFGLSLAGGVYRGGPLRRWLWAPLCASFWATACTAPLTLYWFGQLAPWTVLATPVLAPLVACMLAGGLLTALSGLVAPALADLTAWPVHGITQAYCQLVAACDLLPGTPILAIARPEGWLLLGAAVAGALPLVHWPDRRGVLALCALLSAPHFVPGRPLPAGLTLLPAGHGQAALAVLADGTTVLVDCGSMGNPRRAARAAVEALQRRRLDWLVLTHGDEDHVGGVAELAARLRIGGAVVPAELWDEGAVRALRAAGVPVLALAPGTRLTLRSDLSLLAPAIAGGPRNDRSLWVRASWPSWSALLTGDALADGVGAALQEGFAGAAEVLVLPHHGRSHPAAAELLAAVRPTLALVSNAAGEGDGEQGRLARRLGIAVAATGECGRIEVADGEPPVLRVERGRPLR